MRPKAEQIEEIAQRLETDGRIAPHELRAVCDIALELLQAAPSQELVRLALLLVSSRGTLPLAPAQLEALGAAVLKAARSSLLGSAGQALQEAHAALATGRNWIAGLERIPCGGMFGKQLPALARSMTKTMHRSLASSAQTLNFGMAGKLEPLDAAEPGYKDVPAFDQMVPRPCTDELEQAQEALRRGRLGILKIARFTHALASSAETRIWDDALARQAAQCELDAGAHLAELKQLLGARERLT